MNGQPKFVCFGPFEVNLEAEELRRKGLLVRLPAQSFQVLRLLLSRPGELVSRPELQRALWPTDSFGDFEHGLNAAVNRLREALGDSADTPRFVETLPRRGYRFIAALDPPSSPPPAIAQLTPVSNVILQHPVTGTTLSASETPLPDLPRPIRTWRKPLLLVASCVAVISMILVPWRWHTASPTTDIKTAYDYSAIQVTPLTALPGSEVAPTFSPDGSQVAFSWDGGNSDKTSPYDLYIKVVGSERTEQLTHRSAAWITPAWSPDGRNIAFARMGSAMPGIFMISALGGPERKLADALFTYFPLISLSWSPDGQRLVFGDDRGVYELSIADGALHKLDAGHDCALMGTPAFSPDGQWLAFSCYLDLSYDLEVMSARGGPAKKLTRVYETPLPLAWTADSTRIIFTEHYQLNTISRKGERPQFLGPQLGRRGSYAHSTLDPAVALHGDRLAYVEWTLNVNLWRMNLKSRKEGTTSILAATSSLQSGPDISPDGRKIAFESERSGGHDVWVSNLDGSEAVEMGHFRTRTGTPRWSPDGKRIVFDSRESGKSGLYLVTMEEGLPRPIDTGNLTAQVPHWSRNGHWIYFNTNAADSRSSKGLYKISPEGGTPQLVTPEDAFNAQESPDGHVLYFIVGSSNGTIHSLDLTTGKEEKLEGMPAVDTPTDWTVASHGIYFIDPTAKPATINFFDFASHRVVRRIPLSKPPYDWGGLALAPDESWLAYSQIDRNDSDLMLAEPFR